MLLSNQLNEFESVIPERLELLDSAGVRLENPRFERYVQGITPEQLRHTYEQMATVRRFDEEATALQRQGQLALWVPSRGQEAAQIGSAFALEPNDYIFPSYREHGVAYARGVDLRELMTVFRGTTTHGWDAKKHNFHPYTLVLAAQTPHAVGYAMGLNLDADVQAETGQYQTGQGQATDPEQDIANPAVAVYFGDGSTTEGEAHEAMVFAASYNAPVLFFVQNNRWAISVPFSVQSRVPIATRAAGYGFEGLRVDGNDILAVIAATRYAMEKIRAGQGPVLIEAETYRMGAHTTADDPTKYRTDEEVEHYASLDPLVRLEKYLRENKLADDSFFETVKEKAQELANGVREGVLAASAPDFEHFFKRVYAAEHPQIEEELAFWREYNEGFEDA